jgi:GH24 family phage-related lysozyme (muramidase)
MARKRTKKSYERSLKVLKDFYALSDTKNTDKKVVKEFIEDVPKEELSDAISDAVDDSKDVEYALTPKALEMAEKYSSLPSTMTSAAAPQDDSIKSIASSVMKTNPARALKKDIKKDDSVDADFTKISSNKISALKSGDSAPDVLSRMYGLQRLDYANYLRKIRADKKFNREQEKLRDERNEELIQLFEQRKKKKPSKKATRSKKQQPKGEKTPAPETKKTKPKTETTATKTETVKETKPTATKGLKVESKTATAAKVVTGAAIAGGAAAVIAKEEGLPKNGKAYWDPPSQKTLVSIGYGHQIKEDEYRQGFIQIGDERVPLVGNRGIDTVLTKEQAQKLLEIDTPKYENSAKGPLGDSWNKLNENQKNALISYAYNTGSTSSLVKAGLKDAIDRGDMAAAAKIIEEKGIKTSGGQYNKVLDERRKREADMFRQNVEILPSKGIPNTNGDNLNNSSIENKDLKKNNTNQQSNVAILNNTKNIINGGTTYSTPDDKSSKPQLMERQYN